MIFFFNYLKKYLFLIYYYCGGSMDSKIKTLLEKLNLSNECKNCFNTAKLLKIVGNKDKTDYTFYIQLEDTLSINNYNEFIDKIRKSFNDIQNINVVFNILNVNNDLIIDYFKEILNILSNKSPMLKFFLNNKIEYTDSLTIYVDNVAELKKLESFKLSIEELLNRVGYNCLLNIIVDSL